MNNFYSTGHYCPNFWLKIAIFGIGCLPFLTARAQKTDSLRKSLQDSVFQLEEVQVSTGYQTLPKERATGSFEHISNEAINLTPGISIIDRLEGTSSILFDHRGANGPKLQIRGLYTLDEGISQPLVILDNFSYEGDLQSINPADIFDVTILKDAAAASIWGARAGNGVIVIRTKKGSYNKKTHVSLASTLQTTSRPNLSKLQLLPSSDFIDLEISLFKLGAYDDEINDTYSMHPLTPVIQLLNERKNGLISAADSANQIDALRKNDVRRDFERYIYRPSFLQSHQASLDGGSENMNYRLSIGYDRNLEELVGNDLNRYTLNLSNQYKPFRLLEINTQIQYSESRSYQNSLGGFGSSVYSLGNDFSSSFQLPIYAQLADNNGNALPIDKYRKEWLDSVGGGRLLDWSFKPLDEINHRNYLNSGKSILVDLGFNIKPMSFLSIETSYQYQRHRSDEHHENDADSYMSRDMINRYTNLNSADANTMHPIPIGGILDIQQESQAIHSFRTQLHVEEELGPNHLSVLAGSEIRQLQADGSNHRTYGYTDRSNVASVDYIHIYPQIVGYGNYIPMLEGYSAATNRYLSFYGNAAFNYQNRFTLSVSGRNDAANLFGVKTRDRWKPLYSAGISWDIAHETFYRSNLLPYLKLRLTYGYQGNVNNGISASTRISYLPASDNTPINVPYAIVSSGENPTLRWETVRQVNAALDFGFPHHRLSGSIDLYFKRSSDVLSYENADPTGGFSLLYRNSAQITGRGLEIQLTSLNIQQGNISWRTNLLLNYNHYEVSKYLYDDNRSTFVSDGDVITPMSGYNPYAILSYRWAGLDPANGNPRGYLNGKVSGNLDSITNYTSLMDLVNQGPALPVVFGNLLNTFTYSNFDLSINIMYKLGYYFRAKTLNYNNLFNTGLAHASLKDRWMKPGDEQLTNVPSLIYPNPGMERDNFYHFADINALKGDHIRLQNVKLGYRYKKVHFYAYADNLHLLLWKANKQGIDPDYPDGMIAPTSYAFGMNVSF
ncbi:TonB-linked outer membrane protein, SusC/RagA family [bacterium A37T11]|nr:TonB-linked outer membrane protein, SusC/RagA family [bacterium A37T11]